MLLNSCLHMHHRRREGCEGKSKERNLYVYVDRDNMERERERERSKAKGCLGTEVQEVWPDILNIP